MACMAAGARASARLSGSSGLSSRASRRAASIGAVPPRDDRLYVREREWEAAHTVWLWIDRSASMGFASTLALQPKIDRALVLGLAAADFLMRGGERVGLLGLTRPLAARNIVERFAEALLAEERGRDYVPDGAAAAGQLPRDAQAVLIGDFLSDPARYRRDDRKASAAAARAAISS